MKEDIQELLRPDEEIWKKVPGFEHYEVSNKGRVRRTVYLRSFTTKSSGYPGIQFFENDGSMPKSKKGRRNYGTKKAHLHRLMAQLFIPNPDNLPYVNHKDGNKLNYELSNLEWCTPRENILHAYRTGLMTPKTDHLNPANRKGKTKKA